MQNMDFSKVKGMDEYLQFLLGNGPCPAGDNNPVELETGITFRTSKETKKCSRCGGMGRLPHYYHIDRGICFKCGGSGTSK